MGGWSELWLYHTCWWFRNPAISPVEGKVVEIPWFTTGFYTSKRWFDSLWLTRWSQASGPSSPPKVPAGGWWKVCNRFVSKTKIHHFQTEPLQKVHWDFLVFFVESLNTSSAFRSNIFSHAAFLEGLHQMSVNIGYVGSPEPRSLSQLWERIFVGKHFTGHSGVHSLKLTVCTWKCIVGIQVSFLGGLFSGASFRCLFVWIQICHTFCSNMTSKM